MGYQTGFMVLNDHLHELKTDPDVGRKMYDAALMAGRGYKPVDFSIGCGANAGIALPSRHADEIQVIAIGGNDARYVGYGGVWNKMDDDISILKVLAVHLGYRLVKNPVRK